MSGTASFIVYSPAIVPLALFVTRGLDPAGPSFP
jgi:hypothetical protein